MDYSQSEKNLLISCDVLQKIILFSKPKALKPLINYSRVHGAIQSLPEIWQIFSHSQSSSKKDCIESLKSQKLFKYKIKNNEKSNFNANTMQSDMTQLILTDNFIFTSSDDQTVHMYNYNAVLLRKFHDHNGGVWALDTEGNTLITGSTDKTAKIWETDKNFPIHTLKYHRSTIRVVRYYKGFVITGSRDNNIAVWTKDGTFLYNLIGHTQSVRCLDIIDRFLVSGSYDGSVKLWNYNNGLFLRDIHLHKKRVYVVKFFRNYIASAGLDSEVRISTLDGLFVAAYKIHSLIVAWLDFMGPFIVSSGSDGNIVKYNYIEKRIEFIIREASPIKSQKIHKGMLVIGTLTSVKIYSFDSGILINEIHRIGIIFKVDCSDSKIVVGYSETNVYKIAIYDYTR